MRYLIVALCLGLAGCTNHESERMLASTAQSLQSCQEKLAAQEYLLISPSLSIDGKAPNKTAFAYHGADALRDCETGAAKMRQSTGWPYWCQRGAK